MVSQFAKVSVLVALGVGLASCAVQKGPPAPAADYQATPVAVAAPANLKNVCFTETELSAFRVRQTQQSLAVGVLQCKAPDGSRLYDKQYQAFITKFNPELASNATELKAIIARKRKNFDVVITEVANRTGNQPTGDAQFCSRQLRALEWALTPGVTSLTQVPSPYDFGQEMTIYPCPK